MPDKYGQKYVYAQQFENARFTQRSLVKCFSKICIIISIIMCAVTYDLYVIQFGYICVIQSEHGRDVKEESLMQSP